MLHWYRLVQLTREERGCASSDHSHLIANHEGSPIASLSPQQREKLFWLGLVEAMPIFAGGVFSICTNSKLMTIVAALIAMVLTAAICWFLRDQVPPTRIELSAQKPNRSLRPRAARGVESL